MIKIQSFHFFSKFGTSTHVDNHVCITCEKRKGKEIKRERNTPKTITNCLSLDGLLRDFYSFFMFLILQFF